MLLFTKPLSCYFAIAVDTLMIMISIKIYLIPIKIINSLSAFLYYSHKSLIIFKLV